MWGGGIASGRAGPCGGWRGLKIDEEDVVLDLTSDAGVPAEDDGEGLAVDEINERRTQMPFIPEAVAVPKAGELIDEDPLQDRTKHGTPDIVLAEAADPEVDLARVTIDAAEAGDDVGVAGDIDEAACGLQSKFATGAVEPRESVIPTPLKIQRSEIETTGSRRAEEKVAHLVDDEVVEFLAGLVGKPAEDGIDSVVLDFARREEGTGERDVSFGGFRAVGVEAKQCG